MGNQCGNTSSCAAADKPAAEEEINRDLESGKKKEIIGDPIQSGNTSEFEKIIGDLILGNSQWTRRLKLITLDYLQMDMDFVDKWIKSKTWLSNSKVDDHLFEPWLQAVSELCPHDYQQQMASFLHDKEILQSDKKYIPQTYLWFAAKTAALGNHKELVLGLIDKLDPKSVCVNVPQATWLVIYSWLYIIWRFLVNLDEEKLRPTVRDWQYILSLTEYSRDEKYFPCDGWTSLHFAAAWGDAKCVEKLLKVPNSIVQLLLQADAGGSKVKDSKGRTPLHHASERGCLDSVKALLDKDVDAVDENGMTPLHLASCRGHSAVVRELLCHAHRPDKQCDKNLTATINRLFIPVLLKERREHVWNSRFSIPNPVLESCFAPNAVFLEPNQLQSEVWCPGGFNALHFAVVYGGKSTVTEILQKYAWLDEDKLIILQSAKDSLGLTPVDWAQAMGALESYSKSNLLVQPINFEKAKTYGHHIRKAEQERRKLEWAIDMTEAILSRRWLAAGCIARRGVTDKIVIDKAVWDHLENAITVVLKHRCTKEYRKDLIERMLAELVSREAFSESSLVMHSFVKWAIKQEMVHLVKEIVENTRKVGIFLTSTMEVDHYGMIDQSSDNDSPLEAASRIKGTKGSQMVAAIEEQAEVKRILLEDRRVYVEYSNTILVGAVLVAALAFQGWVQTPQGYAGMPLDSSSKGMLLFARCNSLGFFFAMGAFMAGAVGAMPPKSGEFVKYSEKVIRAACVASLLMAVAVACQVVGFASALVAIQSGGRHNIEDMLVSSKLGTIIIFILSAWFLARLNNVINIFWLLLEALPRTLHHMFMVMFNFWHTFGKSPPFRRFVLYPFYGLVLYPLPSNLRQRVRDITGSAYSKFQSITHYFKSKLDALRKSIDSWLEKQQDLYEGKEGNELKLEPKF
ncbi:hypothetical protein GOP47_0030722 [Adiantum capillus-veneris]|nr:hypothetical protein GOP47_0030721 [Adiantum capillus-veneris]KAI5054360.1 hypothetical protein GOP47_0030722 [Adiantum capillus-veneris]